MSASDWLLVFVICVCNGVACLAVGHAWGRWSRIRHAEATIEELHKLYAAAMEDNARLRNDLTQQLNDQFER